MNTTEKKKCQDLISIKIYRPYGPKGPASIKRLVSTQGALSKPATIHDSKLIMVSGTESMLIPLHL